MILNGLPCLKKLNCETIFDIVVFGNLGDIDFDNFGAIDLLEGSSLPPGGSP